MAHGKHKLPWFHDLQPMAYKFAMNLRLMAHGIHDCHSFMSHGLWHRRMPRFYTSWPASLAKQVAYLLVYMAEEVDVRGAAIQALVLNQEVVEPALQLVTLTHDCQLSTHENGFVTK